MPQGIAKRPEGESRSNRSGENAKRVGRSAVEREFRSTLLGVADASLIVGSLDLGCALGWVPGVRAGSGFHLLNDNDVPLV